VHLASIGHPIVGDTLYGGPASESLAHGRFWLHLCDVAFDSPAVGHVKVTAPIPPDLKMLIEQPLQLKIEKGEEDPGFFAAAALNDK
jgi:23S rRNA pseudouridine1911/1915/1917 synthase